MTRDERKLLVKNLRHVCGVFDNGDAPAGFVEIQAFDERDTGPEDLPSIDDLEAGLLVCEAAKHPGVAFALFPVGVLVSIVWTEDGDAVLDLESDRQDVLASWGDDVPSYRVVVPTAAARAARLLTAREEMRARRSAT